MAKFAGELDGLTKENDLIIGLMIEFLKYKYKYIHTNFGFKHPL